MKIGQFNQLIVSNKNEHGYYLEDRSGACVFIAKLFAENHWQIGDEVKVFIYQDENEIKATIEEPFIQVGEFGILNCVNDNHHCVIRTKCFKKPLRIGLSSGDCEE